MSSTTPLSTTPPSNRSTRTTRRRSPRHPFSRLAAGVGAVGLALALAACGSDEPTTGEELAAEASEAGVPEALQDYAETLGDDVDVPTEEEAKAEYEEWLEGKTSDSSDASEDETEQSESASEPGSGGSGNSPAVGDCLDHLPTGAEDTDAEAPLTDCAGPHAADVIAVVELGDLGSKYPDPVTLFHTATDRCGDAYLERFGAPVIDTGVTPSFVSPTHETWEDGDTAVYCYAYPVGLETYSGELKAENQ